MLPILTPEPRSRRGAARIVFFVGSLMALPACQPRFDEAPTTVAIPPRFSTPQSAGDESPQPSIGRGQEDTPEIFAEAPDDAPWWEGYDDPHLADLIAFALQHNVSLRTRSAAVAQARALETQARAARFPTVSAQGTVGYSRSVSAFATINAINVQGSLPVSYELDLFARATRQTDAARLDAEASEFDRQSAALTLSTEIAEAWYSLIDVRLRKGLLEEQKRLAENYLELVRLRFEQGLTSAVDMHQQRQQVAAIDGQLELITGSIALRRQQLAVLLGTPLDALPGSLFGGDDIPLIALGEAPEPGPPAEVLRQRPDLRAAEQRLRASDHRVSAAIASRLPSIRLTVTPGYSWQRNEFEGDSPFGGAGGGGPQYVSGFTFNAGATLNVPLFDGFAGRGRVEQSEAAVQMQVEAYTQLVLQALMEVETAIVQERQGHRQVAVLEGQLAIAEDTLRAARDRYRQGLSDFLPVLTALQAKQRTELELLTARRTLISHRLQLHRALGGTWPESLAETAPRSLESDSHE